MDMFQNEELIMESNNKQVYLTSHRVRCYESTKKNANFISIMLDRVSSVELTYYKSSIWLLIIGIVTIPIVVGVILIIMYFASKKHVISITPDGGKPIIIQTFGMKRERMTEFITKVEEASLKIKGNL